jgi:hypothetical protein
MNFTKLLLLLITIVGFTPANAAQSGQTTVQDVQRETMDLLHTLKDYTVDNKDLAVKKSKTALDNLDQHIEALEAQVKNNYDKMDREARDKAMQSLKVLREQRIKVAETYGSLKESSDKAWGHLKKGFSDAYQNLYDAWEKSQKEFGSD